MAGITWWNFYVRVFPGSIKAPQIIEFLTHLLRHLRRPLLVIWDGLPGHRSRDVRDFVRAHDDRLTLEVLPGYAPALNPVEHIWSYLKQHELPNLCPRELWQLSDAARGALRRMRRRPTLVCAFWKQAGLFDERHLRYVILVRWRRCGYEISHLYLDLVTADASQTKSRQNRPPRR